MLCYVWRGRRESNPRHTAWEAVVLPLNYARTDSVFRHSADGVPTKTGTSVPLYHRTAAPSSSTSATAPRSLTGRPWPPPQKRRNPAAFAGRGVSQIGHLRASSTTTANAKSVARWRQTNSTGCHSVSLRRAACVPGFDRWGGRMSKPTRPPSSRRNGAGFITQLERWLGEYD